VKVVSLAPASSGERTVTSLEVRPALMLRIALALLALANLGRIPLLDLGEREAPILINDLAVMAVIGVAAASWSRARSLKLDDVALAALTFAGVGALSAVSAIPRFGLTVFELVASLAYLARWLTYFVLYLVVINSLRREEVFATWRVAEWVLLALAAFGIVQAIFLPDFALMVYPESRAYFDWDPQRHRLVSTVLDPNLAAFMFVIGLLLFVARMANGIAVPLWKPLLLMAALVMTLSRSGMLAFIVGLGVIVWTRGITQKMMRFGVAIGLLGLAALPKLITTLVDYSRIGVTDASALARVISWQRAIVTFLESPWFGVGFNTYGYVQERRGFERFGAGAYSAEGGLLFIAVMTGIVGVAVFIAMLWLVLRRCRRGWTDPRSTPEERGLLIGTAAATVAMLVHSLFANSLLLPFVLELVWVLWGMTFLITRRESSSVREAA
jgi:O-antigen ligase